MRRINAPNMTVRELIEHLAQFDGDAEVVTRNFYNDRDSVTINFVGAHDCIEDAIFYEGADRQVVVIG